MSNIQTILKLNGLNCLLFGALFVFIPKTVINFLSETQPMPEVVMLSLGVVLNLYGLLLLWLGNQPQPNRTLVLLIALGDFLWVIGTVIVISTGQWITAINGITAAGLVSILVGWFGWLQLQHHKNQNNA